MKSKGHLKPMDLLLFIGMMVFSLIIFICNVMFPMDGQIFQVYSGVLGAFSGAFFARLKDSNKPDPDPSTTTTTTVTTPSEPTGTGDGK